MPSFSRVTALPLLLLSAATAVSSLPWPLSLRQSTQTAKDLCGNSDYLVLNNTPWIVYNMVYNAAQMVGTQCTHYEKYGTTSAGVFRVEWSSATHIDYVESTNNVPKGYSFVGLTQNLETPLSSISAIPTTYTWQSQNTTAFKGNVCYDFMTSDTKGDSTSTAAKEHMLWLTWTGGQLPIGWVDGPVATIDGLFGTSWKLYEGKNDDTGITVSTLMPDKQFDGSFSGDVKEWLQALERLGKFGNATYVNVGNAGTEFFYGDRTMNATLGLEIELST